MKLGKINDRWELRLPEDRIEFHGRRHGWEAERLDHCAQTMQPGMAVYDLGAESGDFTALYRSWVGESGQVVPVEPSLPYWPSIRQTWEANGFAPPAHWFPGFVSDVTDLAPAQNVEARLRGASPDGWPWCSVGTIAPDFGFRHLAQQADCTPQITVDDLVSRTGLVPDVIVMDIEGAEYRALVGARQTLAEYRPLMYVSVHPATMLDWYGIALDELLDLMVTDCRYSASMLGEDSEQYWVFTP